MRLIARLNQAISSLEHAGVDLVSAAGPWLAPLAPAVISYLHLTRLLDFPAPLALVIAAVIESLGLSTGSTLASFWFHNRRYSAEKNKVPTLAPIFAFVFYLALVVSLNVLIALPWAESAQAIVQAITNGLLTLMSVPAIVILSIRRQHTAILQALARNPNTATQATIAMPQSPDAFERNSNGNHNRKLRNRPSRPRSHREDVLRLLAQQPDASHSDIARQLGISRQAVSRHIHKSTLPD